ncbi:hypothetical protein [Mycolicibacterium neoaurum]|uniref:hypothetical protein n=1 Tax=Mycolicibacterium neoaurum TaxID=1795 RepID=UPI001F4CCCD8|nr:hypothetical protein [Mycolicibacterium neoaurum]
MPYTLQEVVDAGYAPSVRWLASGIKAGSIPGRMIGRYWKNWLMTDEDFEQYLEARKPKVEPPRQAAESLDGNPIATNIAAGLSPRCRRRIVKPAEPNLG